MGKLFSVYVTELRSALEAETTAYRATTTPERADRQFAIVIFTLLLSVLTIRFYAAPDPWMELFRALGWDGLRASWDAVFNQAQESRFHRRVFWAGMRVFVYILIPLFVIKVVLRDSVERYGMRLRGILPSAKVYLLLFTIILPFVIWASQLPSFQQKYPYYRLQPGESLFPFFFGWELLYALQFIGLEFFYRGFVLHGLRFRIGYPALFVMMVPYMMIHFWKPFPEAVGSIIAGFILGTLSLKSRSIWWGAAIHIAVAWLMDWLSLYRQGLLG